MIRTRFAPSPTGRLHVGGLRSALFNYLLAKKNQGNFLLRIEDTDQTRLMAGGIENILNSLVWAGIVPDEGVIYDSEMKISQKGGKGPYIQSERLSTYQKYAQELLKKGFAYYCFCTKDRLEEIRTVQECSKLPTGYDGHCRELNSEHVAECLKKGMPYVIRLRMPREGVTTFTDLIRGEVTFKNELIDDQVLIKADGFPTYHLAVVVDDHLMEITHVIRGEEWLPSTPKHIQLYKMFGWKQPQFAHLPLLVNEQKQKLSKRHGDVSVEDYQEKGYLPEALVNFVAFLGWNPGDEREIFSLSALEKEFDFSRVSKAAAVFNVEKLDWYNQQYLRRYDQEALAILTRPFFQQAGLPIEDRPLSWLAQVVALEQSRASTLKQIVENTAFIFSDELSYEASLLVWKKSTREETKKNLGELTDFLSKIEESNWIKEDLEKSVGDWIKIGERGVGEILWPLRVSLSGKMNSPGPYEIAAVLGKTKTLDRLHQAQKLLLAL